MPYKYQEMREELFTDKGQRLFMSVRDNTQQLIARSGAARCQEMIAGQSGDSWLMLACVDRMVELGEIREITDANSAGQHRVFVRK